MSTMISSNHLKHPSSSLFPAFLPPFGPLSEETGGVGPIMTDARSQEARVARENGLSLADVLKQREIKDEPHWKTDILYQEGVIVLSSHVGPDCCEDVIRSLSREIGLQRVPNFSVALSPVITSWQDAWESSAYLWGVSSAIGLNSSTFLQPPPRQRSCCAWETERPDSCCFEIQTFPRSSTLPLAHVQPTDYSAEPSRRRLLTEYQSSYAAEWAQPKRRQGDFHHHLPPCHWNFRPSV